MPFQKGKSGNPRGRPPLALSERIREKVDPDELIQIALELARDENAFSRDRMAAVSFLAERGWVKPPQTLAVAHVPAFPSYDYNALSTDELRTLEGLMSKMPLLPSGDEQ